MDNIEQIEELLGQKLKGKPTMIDFNASWCPPCILMAPRIDEIKKTHTNINVIKVSTDEESGKQIYKEFAKTLNTKSIPLFLFFDKDGHLVDHVIGAYTDQIDESIKKLEK